MDRKTFMKSTVGGAISLIPSTILCKTESQSKILERQTEPKVSIPLPTKVAEQFSLRSHRLHHCLWHGLRDYWNNENLVSITAKADITKLNWNPVRPALAWNRDGWTPLTTNGSGIDFLYMHREMIIEFDNAMKIVGENPDLGWKLIPEPGRPENTHPGLTVPPSWELPEPIKWLERRFAAVKSDEFYWSRIRWWDRQFHDHGYLRTLTLGQLGSILETSVHNDMHMRWASQPTDPETGQSLIMGRPENDMNAKWDNVNYDFLGETYSSQVNPIFWRLHKWVDSIIDEWYLAHNSFKKGSVIKIVLNKVPWFKSVDWIEVNNPWSYPSPHAHHDITKMENVFSILFPPSFELLNKLVPNRKPMNWF